MRCLCRLVTPALAAIREAARRPEIDAVSKGLLDAHIASGKAAEFLIASVEPRKLVIVKEGGSEEGESGWLSDYDAFAEYQRYYHQDQFVSSHQLLADDPERAQDLEIATRMRTGFDAVLSGPRAVVEDGKQFLREPSGGSRSSVGEAIIYAVQRISDYCSARPSTRATISTIFRRAHMPCQRASVCDPAAFVVRLRTRSILTPEERDLGSIGLSFQRRLAPASLLSAVVR